MLLVRTMREERYLQVSGFLSFGNAEQDVGIGEVVGLDHLVVALIDALPRERVVREIRECL